MHNIMKNKNKKYLIVGRVQDSNWKTPATNAKLILLANKHVTPRVLRKGKQFLLN
jgi:predicted Ser/Thr protein kinase